MHHRAPAPNRLDWRLVGPYPVVLTLAFAALIACSMSVGEPRDQKFAGWAGFWIAFGISVVLHLPLASLTHVLALRLAIDLRGTPSTSRLVAVHVAAGVLHPLGWFLLGYVSPPPGVPPLLLIVPGLLAVPAVVDAALVWALVRPPEGRAPDAGTRRA